MIVIEGQQAAQQHVKYIQSLSALSAQTAVTKQDYCERIATRRQVVVKEVARVMCGLAEGRWRNCIDGTRRAGETIGAVAFAGVLCSAGLPEAPGDLVHETVDGPVSPAELDSVSPTKNSSTSSGLRGPRPQPGSEHEDSAAFRQNPDAAFNFAGPSQAGSIASRPGLARQQNEVSQYSPGPNDTPQHSLSRPANLNGQHEGRSPTLDHRRPSGTESHRSSMAASLRDTRRSSPPPGGVHFASREAPVSSGTQQPTYEQEVAATEELRAVTGGTGFAEQQRTVQRPRPRYGTLPDQMRLGEQPTPPPQQQHQQRTEALERADTTASERSFVARMRERYAEEKQQRAAEHREAAAATLENSPQMHQVRERLRIPRSIYR